MCYLNGLEWEGFMLAGWVLVVQVFPVQKAKLPVDVPSWNLVSLSLPLTLVHPSRSLSRSVWLSPPPPPRKTLRRACQVENWLKDNKFTLVCPGVTCNISETASGLTHSSLQPTITSNTISQVPPRPAAAATAATL